MSIIAACLSIASATSPAIRWCIPVTTTSFGVQSIAAFSDRLGAHETRKIGTRVWKAVSEYAFGTDGRSRFRDQNRPLHFVEGKNNVAGNRWNRDTGCVTWGKLVLPARLPSKQQDSYLHEAMRSSTRYCRLVWRIENGQRRWFVQRDCYSALLAKHATQDGHSPSRLAKGWAVAQPLPERAGKKVCARSRPGCCTSPDGEPGYPSHACLQNPWI
ncbi:hypothetical protein [Orrella marina]|uniref:hypothetical protein n=1 Tax=Orrella marina TaxID=2163011 RepID=UPI00131F3AB7|nr:hypothetical protein [Orrella marina]